MFRTKLPSAGDASPAHGSNHANIIGLGAACLTAAVLYFNGTYGFSQGSENWGLALAFVGFAIVKDGAMSYAWSARGEYGRFAAAILSVIALLISCLAAIGAASSGKQEASDPKAKEIAKYDSAERTRDAANKRLAELGNVGLSVSQAKARAADLLSKVDAAIARRTASCTNLAPTSNGSRQVAVNREACQPYIEANAVAETAAEIERVTAKRDAAEAVMSEGKPATADSQASTIAWFLSLFWKIKGIDSIQAFTNLMIGLGLEISSPLAWASYASAKHGRGRVNAASNKVGKIDIAAVDVAGQSDFPAVAEAQFAELKQLFTGEQPNGPSAIVVPLFNPNGSPNGSGPQGPKPGRRQRFAKDEALEDLRGRLDSGERFGSQDELASRYGVAKSTMSDWLGEWEGAGLIPARMTVGRCKAVAG